MAISKRNMIQKVVVKPTGELIVYEATEFWEGGFSKGARQAISPVNVRRIEVGDDVSMEDKLVQDIVSGDLHDKVRISAADAAKLKLM